MKRLTILLGMIIVLWGGTAWAACTGSSPTWSCSSWVDLQTLVGGASIQSGDTVTLAAGTYNISSKVTVPNTKKITIRGAGTTCPTSCSTIINSSVGNVFNIGKSGSRIAYFKILNSVCVENLDGVVVAKHKYWQIDHNHFECVASSGKQSALSYSHAISGGTTAYPDYYFGGVFHSNKCIESTVDVYGSAFSLSAAANASAAAPTRLGSDEAVYIEDNEFINSDPGNFIDTNYLGSYVFRFNYTYRWQGSRGTATGSNVEVHGLSETTGKRGPKKWEIYWNTLKLDEGDAGLIRGGTGVLFNNTVDAQLGGLTNLKFDNRRSPPGYVAQAPLCDGSVAASNYDGNDGVGASIGWLCRDQIGAGADKWAYDGTLPLPDQYHEPVYTWGNVNANIYVQSPGTQHILADRDVYYNSGITDKNIPQTTGVRSGLKVNLPQYCTAGVGYWVTDEGHWNSKTPGADGVLYKCTGNAWTPFYIPYPYPHPIRSGLAAPTGVTVK